MYLINRQPFCKQLELPLLVFLPAVLLFTYPYSKTHSQRHNDLGNVKQMSSEGQMEPNQLIPFHKTRYF